MTEFTEEKLAELRAVAEAAEPMVVFGGLAQGAYVSIEKHELLALIAALEAKTAEVEGYKQHYPCDGGCSYGDGPQEECSQHGRNPRDLWDIITHLARERDEARAEVEATCDAASDQHHQMVLAIKRADRAEAALERVKELHHDAGESQGYTSDVRGGYGMIPHCCASCGSFGEYGEPWPCPTIQAIEGE